MQNSRVVNIRAVVGMNVADVAARRPLLKAAAACCCWLFPRRVDAKKPRDLGLVVCTFWGAQVWGAQTKFISEPLREKI